MVNKMTNDNLEEKAKKQISQPIAADRIFIQQRMQRDGTFLGYLVSMHNVCFYIPPHPSAYKEELECGITFQTRNKEEVLEAVLNYLKKEL